MLSTMSGLATSALHRPCPTPLSRLAAPAVARLAPSAPAQPLMAQRLAATSVISRHLSLRASAEPQVRDWPAAGEAADGAGGLGPSGKLAWQAALHARPSREEIHQAREIHARRTGQGIHPGLSALTTRVGMAMALESSRDDLVAGEGPGVAAGLRDLAIGPGDAIAEQDPLLPSLGVRLALDGARAFITVSHPARLREVTDELERYRQGRPLGLRTVGLDFKPLLSQAHFVDRARAVSRQLLVLPGPGFGILPLHLRFKALVARSAFDYLDRPRIQTAVRDAGRCLQPGGGLVFEFAHAAGRAVPASAGVALGQISFREIEDALRQADLCLRSLYVTYHLAGDPDRPVIPTRRVRSDADGRIPLQKADAAAWSGWDEIARHADLQGRPVRIQASGLFVKQAQAQAKD